jgi:4-hydroxybenzoate polyprenyltransferase
MLRRLNFVGKACNQGAPARRTGGAMTGEPASPLARRFWRYRAERFPLVGAGGLALLFGLAAVCYGAALDRQGGFAPNLSEAMCAMIVTAIAFFHLQVIDEHRDFESDRVHHPRRAVARGLVSLQELRSLSLWGAVLQGLLTILLHPPLLALLLIVWIWTAFIAVDFLEPEAMPHRPLLRLTLQMFAAPLIGLCAAGFGLFTQGGPMAPALLAFMAMTLTNAFSLELARKTLAAGEERLAVDTYSKAWGPKRAGLVLAGMIAIGLLTTLCAYLGAGAPAVVHSGIFAAQTPVIILAPAIIAGFIAFIAAIAFADRATLSRSRLMYKAVGATVLVNYLCVGVLPALR